MKLFSFARSTGIGSFGPPFFASIRSISDPYGRPIPGSRSGEMRDPASRCGAFSEVNCSQTLLNFSAAEGRKR